MSQGHHSEITLSPAQKQNEKKKKQLSQSGLPVQLWAKSEHCFKNREPNRLQPEAKPGRCNNRLARILRVPLERANAGTRTGSRSRQSNIKYWIFHYIVNEK